MQYLKIHGYDRSLGFCSDNNCPCPQLPIPRGQGYFFVEELNGHFYANLTCEEGAKLRNLDLQIAHNDAKSWWTNGIVPARETPKNYSNDQVAPFTNKTVRDNQKKLRDSMLETLQYITKSLAEEKEKPLFIKNSEGYFFKDYKPSDKTYPEVYITKRSNSQKSGVLSLFSKPFKDWEHLEKEVSVGKAEKYFYSHLVDFFGKDRILTNVGVGQYEKKYVPDFVYYDDDQQIKIDIEIDEPYSFAKREPIHFGECDNIRNSFFLKNEWSIVRFSEEQIIRYPERCCKVINDSICEILGVRENKFSSDFIFTSSLPKFKKWDSSECESLEKLKYREHILQDVYFSNFQKNSK